jgi:RIO-like serine/threonine protein kinase
MKRRLKLTRTQFIDQGQCGQVYAVGDFAVKVYWGRGGEKFIPEDPIIRGINSKKDFHKEYSVARDLYSAGISVPRPYGIVRVEVDGEKRIGYAMERIKGKPLDWVGNLIRSKKIKERDAEIAKAKRLGFIMDDTNDGNVMVRESDGQIVLVDFENVYLKKKLEETVKFGGQK